MYRNSYAAVDLNKLTSNVEKIVKTLPDGSNIFAVLKGGANMLSVATLEEAVELREANIKDCKILVMGATNPSDVKVALNHNIDLTAFSLRHIKELIKLENNKQLNIHVKLNTGMNRIGLNDKTEIVEGFKLLNDCK
jgi:alanine racemase